MYVTKAYSGSRCLAPLILNLGARWTWVANVAPLPLDSSRWEDGHQSRCVFP